MCEVSFSSTWLWIELWFASLYGTKIICMYKKWANITSSLKYVCKDFIEYENSEDMFLKKNFYYLKNNYGKNKFYRKRFYENLWKNVNALNESSKDNEWFR